MRYQHLKLKKHHSTKAERKFLELLKRNHIHFRTKIKIDGKEIDFLIGKYAIEIDGHGQNVQKNWQLIKLGYNPIHFNNWEINDNLKEWLKTIWQEQDFSLQQEQQ